MRNGLSTIRPRERITPNLRLTNKQANDKGLQEIKFIKSLDSPLPQNAIFLSHCCSFWNTSVFRQLFKFHHYHSLIPKRTDSFFGSISFIKTLKNSKLFNQRFLGKKLLDTKYSEKYNSLGDLQRMEHDNFVFHPYDY